MGYFFQKSSVSLGAPIDFKQSLGLSWLQLELGFIGAFTIEGTDETDTLFGSRRIEGIIGGDGDDSLDAGDGDDMIYGGDGKDTIFGSVGDGSDSIDGGASYDILTYHDRTSIPIVFDFARSQVSLEGELDELFDVERVVADASTRDLVSAATSDRDTTINLSRGFAQNSLESYDISRFEFITSGDGNDSLIGNGAENKIRGNDGNDMLEGRAGNDTLNGGNGTDTLKGGAGDDILNGFFGSNDLADYRGHAAVTFNTALGQATESSGTDTLLNIDIIRASDATSDVVDASGQGADVTIHLNTGTISATNSGLSKVQDFEHIIGGAGDDDLDGDDESNSITGGAGNDEINALEGADTILMGVGHGNDDVDGGEDDDIVDYQTDTAAITFNVQSGTVADGTSTDTLNNVETIQANASLENVVNASTASSAVTINLDTDALSGPGDVDHVIGFRHIIGSTNDDTLTGDDQNNSITGGQGNDTMVGGDGDDTFVLGDGHGDDTITGGDDDDTVGYTTSDTVTFNTEAGTVATGDSLDSLSGIETIIGSSGSDDLVDASDETDAVTINLTTGLVVGLTLVDVTSLQGFEHIIGGAAADTLTASTDNNSITGGLGNDTLDGGDGSDTFIYLLDSDDDTISDTTSGDSDVLDFSGAYALADVSAWHAVDTDDDGNELDALQIVLTDGNTITVQGYFDNATAVQADVVAGNGVMSSINFSGGDNQDFAEVFALLS